MTHTSSRVHTLLTLLSRLMHFKCLIAEIYTSPQLFAIALAVANPQEGNNSPERIPIGVQNINHRYQGNIDFIQGWAKEWSLGYVNPAS